jgi:hypothetical protein
VASKGIISGGTVNIYAIADAKNYALLLAAISKYSETSGQDVADVIHVLKADLSDLNLDSTGDLLTAITGFLASDKNKTGISDATALLAIIEINKPQIIFPPDMKQPDSIRLDNQKMLLRIRAGKDETTRDLAKM